MVESVTRIVVLGAGTMGHGIAYASIAAGYDTTIYDVAQPALDKGRRAIEGIVAKGIELGKVDAADGDAMLRRLTPTTDLSRALSDADFIIEASPERIDVKIQLFAEIEHSAPAHAIVASNTSALSITELAATLTKPGRVAGMHFFNPVHRMKLVEIVQTILTDEKSIATAHEWVEAVGKTPVRTKDSTAFVVNRLLVPYLLDAIRLYEGGLASLEDIDQAMKLGCGYPMGPFTLLDLVGLDTAMFVAEVMFDEFREPRYAPPPLLKRMVMAGHLGRKAGKGFYDYGKKA